MFYNPEQLRIVADRHTREMKAEIDHCRLATKLAEMPAMMHTDRPNQRGILSTIISRFFSSWRNPQQKLSSSLAER